MQSDDVIWDIIKTGHCSFKTKVINGRTFCRNVNNVNGLCKKPYCPLANSRYATIRERRGICYLYIKTAERAHCPKKLWQMIKLPRNYLEAIKIVSEHLRFFPKPLKHRNKQRLTKIHQYLIRMRKLRLHERTKLVTVNKKVERREKKREAKALVAAKLTENIEKELLERLKQGTYKDIYNFPELEYSKVLNKVKKQNENEEEEEEEELEEEREEEEEDDDDEDEEDNEPEIQYIEDFEESDQDIEDAGDFGAMDSDFDNDFAFGSEGDFDDEEEEKSNTRQRQLTYDDDDDDDDRPNKRKSVAKSKPSKRSIEGPQNKSNKRQKKGTHINIEYEEEEEEEPRQLQRQQIPNRR